MTFTNYDQSLIREYGNPAMVFPEMSLRVLPDKNKGRNDPLSSVSNRPLSYLYHALPMPDAGSGGKAIRGECVTGSQTRAGVAAIGAPASGPEWTGPRSHVKHGGGTGRKRGSTYPIFQRGSFLAKLTHGLARPQGPAIRVTPR